MKITVGRSDKADFPELSLFDIDLKIDSGAYTSSIHCTNIEEIYLDGERFIQFTLLDPTHSLFDHKQFKTKKYSSKAVKSSNGITEMRFLIETEIIIFNQLLPIHLTLTERNDMKFPILLGRKFLNKKFLIDPAKNNLSHKLKYKKECEL
jgi:hypothetical protein